MLHHTLSWDFGRREDGRIKDAAAKTTILISSLKMIFGSASILSLDMVRITGWAGFATLSHTVQIHMSHSLNSFKGF